MRLSEFEKDAIKESVLPLDPEAKIFLFGSRADDTQKGGDIDTIAVCYPEKSGTDWPPRGRSGCCAHHHAR